MNPGFAYADYLQTRSLKGLLYRRHWLYPKVSAELDGLVLDVGCGIGDMLAYRPGTIGVDIDASNIEWCTARQLDARLMEPDVLPFDASTFDGVILDNVLEHIAEPRPLLSEIRRVLKPASKLVVGVPGRKGYASDPDHKIFYDQPGLTRCLVLNGFDAVKYIYMPLKLDWLDSRLKLYAIYGVFVRAS